MKAILTVSLALFAFAFIVSLTECASPQVKEDAAISAYAAEQLRCVDTYNTRPEIDACRKQVRARWGVTETVTAIKDAGADQ